MVHQLFFNGSVIFGFHTAKQTIVNRSDISISLLYLLSMHDISLFNQATQKLCIYPYLHFRILRT